MEDQVPLSKLVVMKKEDAAHLQLVARASEINRTLGMLIEAYGFLDDDTSFGLDLTEDPHDVRATLMDLQKLLEEVPFDRRKVLRNVNQALVYWATVYEEPRPDDLERLMTHLRKLKEGLEGKTPFPTDTNSSTEAGHRHLDELGVAHSKSTATVERGTEDGNGARTKEAASKAKWQAARGKVNDLKATLQAAQALEKESLNSLAKDRKYREQCELDVKLHTTRLEQLEECQHTMESRLESLRRLEDPVALSIKAIMAYSLPEMD